MEESFQFGKRIASARKKIPKKAIFCYSTNLDSVIEIGLPEAGLVFAYLPGLLESMQKGNGMEARISESAFRKVKELLPPGSPRIGGPAGIMALDAARLGVRSYLHTPSKSGELLSLFRSDRVLVASEKGFVPARDVSDDSGPPIHLILEFKKGPGIASSNRFIASHESVNPSLVIDPLFSRRILDELPGISKGIVAGFHLLSPEVFKRRKGEVLGQISSWKRTNPHLKLHLEWGSFISKETEKLVVKHALPLFDCAAFNEDEFPSIMRALGRKEELGGIRDILEKTGTAVLHTRDYSLAFSREFSSESLADSLTFASFAAGFKASKGRAPAFRELGKTRFRLKKIKMPKVDGKRLAKQGVAFALSPSVEVTPKLTVGLGDCFSMAFFLSLK